MAVSLAEASLRPAEMAVRLAETSLGPAEVTVRLADSGNARVSPLFLDIARLALYLRQDRVARMNPWTNRQGASEQYGESPPRSFLLPSVATQFWTQTRSERMNADVSFRTHLRQVFHFSSFSIGSVFVRNSRSVTV